MKFNPTKSTLAAVLLLGSALTHATPTVESDLLDSLWQWLLAPTQQMGDPLCPDAPACPPPAASEQTPEQQSSTKGDG